MIETDLQKKRLLSIAVALLVLLNCIVGFNFFAGSTSGTASNSINAADTTRSRVQIDILNGCGVNGVGGSMTQFCRDIGYDVVEMGNYKHFDVAKTIVIDRNGKFNQSKLLAMKIGVSPDHVIQQFSDDHLVAATIVIGKDYASLLPWKK